MCFSETFSYLNGLLLLTVGILKYKKIKLSLLLIIISFQEFFQGLLYHFFYNENIKNKLGILSWLHFTVHPFFINYFFSYFDNNFKYWNNIYIISIIFGLLSVFILYDLNIFNHPPCKKIDKYDDFCSKKTGAYKGTYHIAYKFKTTNRRPIFILGYYILSLIPVLFTKAKLLSIINMLYIALLAIFFRKSGEFAATWCFTTTLFYLPIVIFEKQVKKYLIYK